MREQVELLTSLDRRVKALEQLETMSRQEAGMASVLLRSEILGLVALRGYWPGSGQNDNGTDFDLTDQSGNNTPFTVGGGQPEHYIPASNRALAVYDGSSDFHMMATDLNNYKILGTETGTATSVRGLTLGVWCYFDNTASGYEAIMTKQHSAIDISYYLYRDDNGYPYFGTTNTGAAANELQAKSSDVIGAASWHFLVGKFDPSTDVQIFHNGTWTTNTTTPHASIYDGVAKLTLGARDDATTPGHNKIDGRLAHVWICAANIEDDVIERLWQTGRMIFGV